MLPRREGACEAVRVFPAPGGERGGGAPRPTSALPARAPPHGRPRPRGAKDPLGRARTAHPRTGPPRRRRVRARVLGRKSELALALREVRDRETGQLLNGVRRRLEAAVAERERALADEELDRRLREEVVDVTLPGEELPLGHLHPITQVRRA